MSQETHQLSWTQLYILRAIENGYGSEREIRRIVRLSRNALHQQIQELSSRSLIQRDGYILRGWRLTDSGFNALTAYGYEPEIPPSRHQAQFSRQEIRHTSTLGTGFRLAFGALTGIFAAWLLIGLIASAIYWAGYQLVVKPHVPEFLLPYIPLDNFLVDLVLGLITSTAFFLPLRRRISLRSFWGGG